jgi:hypothetical protein
MYYEHLADIKEKIPGKRGRQHYFCFLPLFNFTASTAAPITTPKATPLAILSNAAPTAAPKATPIPMKYPLPGDHQS